MRSPGRIPIRASEAASAATWRAASAQFIADRKKDLIVNDKGDNISPQKVEGLLTLEPEIEQAMVTGDRRPYLVALVVPAGGADPAAVQRAIDRANAKLSVIEKVRRFALADAPFATANGQLTPSLKVRRHVVREAYGPRLDALYRGGSPS